MDILRCDGCGRETDSFPPEAGWHQLRVLHRDSSRVLALDYCKVCWLPILAALPDKIKNSKVVA